VTEVVFDDELKTGSDCSLLERNIHDSAWRDFVGNSKNFQQGLRLRFETLGV